ncbi:hypothetical protein EDD76_11637 [Kineothrix alysoides]|uniref:CAAX prenyl protease 2/Lysostaphin resistance protein A-like domain-containing protein n=2 Tax=Kineothrix alysoides TaxID=1469948 RepID=A0A4R1QPD2_9FIRM|nr:hypothetical protein EDD76_11637 [Kineothrix alysoides]
MVFMMLCTLDEGEGMNTNMKTEKNRKPEVIIMATFIFCFVIRFFEALQLRFDETILNENFVHKLSGILALAIVLRLIHLTWKEIGFDFKRLYIPILLGLGLGTVRFIIGYGVEYAILSAQGANPSFSFFLSSFSVTGVNTTLPAYCIILFCIFNLINAVMEEGIFRGLFIKLAQRKYSFAISNTAAALLFGIWHIVMPIRSWLDGTMTFQTMILYSVGYIFLSGSIALMWGMLFEMSGVIWIGLADHFFNNAVINLLHISTDSGIDEMMIARTLIAQLFAFALIAVLYINQHNKAVTQVT